MYHHISVTNLLCVLHHKHRLILVVGICVPCSIWQVYLVLGLLFSLFEDIPNSVLTVIAFKTYNTQDSKYTLTHLHVQYMFYIRFIDILIYRSCLHWGRLQLVRYNTIPRCLFIGILSIICEESVSAG